MSSMNLFHTRGLCGLALSSRSSKSDINMMEKATAIFVPTAIPCVCTKCLLLNLKEFSSKTSRISSLRNVVGTGGFDSVIFALRTDYVHSFFLRNVGIEGAYIKCG